MARGCILKRKNKDGSTTYSIKYRSADGTQIKRAAGRTRKEAEQALTAALAAVDAGKLRSSTTETFAEAAERWLDRKRPLLEQSTFEDYDRHLRLRLLPAFGQMKLRSITRTRVESYVTTLDRENTLSRKTINDSLIPLRQILGRAVRDGVLATNPAESPDRDTPIELPYERPQMHAMTRDQARMYLDSASNDYRVLAEVLLGGGLRIGEALALEWTDINWDTGTLAVSKTFKVGGVGSPKGDRARRVAVDSIVLAALCGHRDSSDASTGLIFMRRNTPIRRQFVHRFWHRPALEDAGLSKAIRLHDLRHTAATLWLASGQSVYFVREQLGHRDIQTTIDLYGHPDQEAHRVAVEQAANWWRQGVSERSQRGSLVLPAVPLGTAEVVETISSNGDSSRDRF